MSPAAWIDPFVQNELEAEMILETFRTQIQPLFPFVVIPPSMSYLVLKQKKPFLVLAILMVGCRHDQARQIALAKGLREIISHNILIKGEQSLDLLQSLLVYVNWYHLHLQLGSQLCNLIHLIMAMMIELGLNKEVYSKNLRPGLFARSGYFGETGSVPLATAMMNRVTPLRSSTARTLEERRTFLGCFFLTSIISMCKRDVEPIRYSRYADECCRAISEAAEYPTDVYVVHLARLHGMAGRISCIRTQEDWHVNPVSTSAPIGACVKSLESELLQLRNSFPQLSHQNIVLLMHYYLMEIFLYEAALNDNMEPLRYGTYPFARLGMLCACLNSTKLCFDTISSFPLSELFDLPHTIWTILGHAIVVLSKLSLLRAAGWDPEYVRSVLDVSECMDVLVRRLDKAKALTGTPSEQVGQDLATRDVPQFFLMLPSKLQMVKAAHEARWPAQTNSTDPNSCLTSAETGVVLTDDNFPMSPMMDLFEFFDEDFWQQPA
ncbi:Fungal specific transcription factor domain-containing protein [Cladophialophora immunda]|nr:Fungal specific transcription factor domain-containing protein [Cladophialophora immunda]